MTGDGEELDHLIGRCPSIRPDIDLTKDIETNLKIKADIPVKGNVDDAASALKKQKDKE